MSDSVSSTSSASGGQILRITGMASGLDVDSMVTKMMQPYQMKIDSAKQQQQLVEWKQQAYQDIIKDVKDLQNSFFDITNSTDYIMSQGNYSGFDFVPADSSIIGGTAQAGAQAGAYNISYHIGAPDEGHLASAATAIGSDLGSTAASKGTSTTLSDLGLVADDSFDITYNGKTKTITVKTTDKLSDVINNINVATSGAVKASYSQLTGKFTIQTQSTGSTQSISVAKGSGTGSALQALKMADETGTPNATITAGQDALLYITEPGGVETPVTRSSNNFTIDNVTYNLVQKKDTTLSVNTNTQKVYDKIKSFLDKYNAVVTKIQSKLDEKKNYSYAPLTDAQKGAMKDSDITAWNTKAQQGILRNDDNLESLLNNLRNAFTSPVVDSNGKSLTSLHFGNVGAGAIGIDGQSFTSSSTYDYSAGPTMYIVNDTKLKDAIANHGDELFKLFTTSSSESDKTKKFNQSGIMERISNILNDNVGSAGTVLNSAILTKYANVQNDYTITGSAGTSTLPNQIYYKQMIVTQLTSSFNDKREAYYMQFSKLETAMEQLNAQQSQLSQLSGGN